jgi:hypothetical protein
MPTTDWNWFFSSVAQFAAAIVGIFGAFIVTKTLANQSAFWLFPISWGDYYM